jgi:hypothetical protein
MRVYLMASMFFAACRRQHCVKLWRGLSWMGLRDGGYKALLPMIDGMAL